jgi:hypothetical protein
VFLFIVLIRVLRSLTLSWKICSYLFGVWILRSALLRSTTLNSVDHLEHLISKDNWVNFEINSVLPSLLLVFVGKVLTCLFTPPPSRQLSVSHLGAELEEAGRGLRRAGWPGTRAQASGGGWRRGQSAREGEAVRNEVRGVRGALAGL